MRPKHSQNRSNDRGNSRKRHNKNYRKHSQRFPKNPRTTIPNRFRCGEIYNKIKIKKTKRMLRLDKPKPKLSNKANNKSNNRNNSLSLKMRPFPMVLSKKWLAEALLLERLQRWLQILFPKWRFLI